MGGSKVTIGVPVYRGEQFVQRALDSVLAQSHTNYEVVISIDGPDPACEEICAGYLKDPRFRMVVQPKNLGWTGNLNWLLGQVTGDFWCFLQQDDRLDPAYLETLIAHATANPQAALVYADLVPIDRAPLHQPRPVYGATKFVRVMTMMHDHLDAYCTPGLTRAGAVRTAGPFQDRDKDNFGAGICWVTGVARHGELHHVSLPLYHKGYHEKNLHATWSKWPLKTRLKAWAAHCLNMLEEALKIQGTAPENRMLWMAAIDRLTSLSVGALFLPVAELSIESRQRLFDMFLEGARKCATNIPLLLDGSWQDILEWNRAMHWLPKAKPYVIMDFGPKSVAAGVVFNRQSNGQSAMWVRLERLAEPGVKLQLGGTVLESVVRGHIVTALVPLECIASAGAKPLMLVGADNEARSDVVTLDVTAQSQGAAT
jgi:glycosyltransferase involved in cell wall biosynthesis